ncbi:MAG: hypothetical protein II332_02220 [Kiritimatiellae bacterium]|nr:hypothetical protein [Kiritimatiellia bacterium]
MDLLLLVAKYGVITAGLFVVASSASKELSLLFARIRKQSKFVQLCVFAFIMTAVVYGGSKPSTNSVTTSTEPLNSFNSNVSSTHSATTSTHTLPQWYIEHGYSSTDTDGDGIPDAWERWTHTKPLSNDALVDYDGDGVDNIIEFMYMCDPIRSDTDGDGLNDMIEIDGLVASIKGLNPVVRATFDIPEPDLDGDGITDLWGDSGYYLFRDVNNDGFDDVYANNMPAASQNNFDIAVTITTTRTALLSSEFGNMLIAPCTNKIVKLRLSDRADEGSVSLSAVPDGVSISGLWKARMDIAFLPRMGQATEKNRIKLYDGFYVDFENMTTDYVGYISPINSRSINSNSNGKVLVCYVPKFLKIYSNGESICLLHGPNHDVTLDVCEELLPVSVSLGDITYEMTEPTIDLLDIFNTATLMCEALTIRVFKDDEQYQEVGIEQDFHLYLNQLCYPSTTNITGVAEYRSLNYLDSASHEPRIETEIVTFGSNCPVATNVNAVIGFSHNKVNTRNLPIIYTSDSRDSNTDHCVGVRYEPSLVILFDDFMDGFNEYKNKIHFKVNGQQMDSLLLAYGGLPDGVAPIVYYIEMCLNESGRVLDRLWITAFISTDLNEFSIWYHSNKSDLGWFAALPKPYRLIRNTNGKIFDPEPDSPDYWSKPSSINSYLHHNASYEMRTETTLTQGNQACYDANGVIITNTIAAGTADRYAPYDNYGLIRLNDNHREFDVCPFLQAIILDGNPCIPNDFLIPTNLDRPCLYQGSFLNKYLECRPTILPQE